MKKVLLINPCIGNKADDLGLSSIAAYLRKKNLHVKIELFNNKADNYEQISEYNPDFIGIPTYNNTIRTVKQIALELKKKVNCIICTGSVFASENFELILNKITSIDYVIVGEGETILYNLIKSIEKKNSLRDIQGIAFRDKAM